MSISIALEILAWLVAGFILLVTVAPLRFKPRLPSRVRTHAHVNLERALAFALMVFLFVTAYAGHRLVVGAVCILAAGLSELLQNLAPSRHARWNDAAAKALGAVTGFALALLALTLLGSPLMPR